MLVIYLILFLIFKYAYGGSGFESAGIAGVITLLLDIWSNLKSIDKHMHEEND